MASLSKHLYKSTSYSTLLQAQGDNCHGELIKPLVNYMLKKY
jgi:hypothetical protein